MLEKDEHWDLILKPTNNWYDLKLKQVWHYRDLLLMFVESPGIAFEFIFIELFFFDNIFYNYKTLALYKHTAFVIFINRNHLHIVIHFKFISVFSNFNFSDIGYYPLN